MNLITSIRTFYTDIVAELKKCTWPPWQELRESTVVVIISVALLSIYVCGLDFLSAELITGLKNFSSWALG